MNDTGKPSDDPSPVMIPEPSDITKEEVRHDSPDQPELNNADAQSVNELESNQSADVVEEDDDKAERQTSDPVDDGDSPDPLKPVTEEESEPGSEPGPYEKPHEVPHEVPHEEPVAGLTSSNLGLVGAVEVTVTLNVGSKRMAIVDILSLHNGSVVSLNRREHDPLDVMINGILFARGEVVRTGEYYGLRILEIL